jgi:parallel beta-helix repeat protein
MSREAVAMKLPQWGHKAVLTVLLAFGFGAFAQEPCTIAVQPGETIQAAIDAAPAGAVICLPADTYRQEHLTIEKSLTLRCSGDAIDVGCAALYGFRDGVPVIDVYGPLSGEVVVALEKLSLWGIEGWDGSGLRVHGNARVTTDRCFIALTSIGIDLQDSAQATITNCTVVGNIEYGVRLQDRSQATIIECKFSASLMGFDLESQTAFGVGLQDAAQATISDCQFLANGTAIDLSASSLAVISGCTVLANELGVALWDSAEATVRDCAFSQNEYGVSVDNHDDIQRDDLTQATIADCTFSECFIGVDIEGWARCSITASSFSQNVYGITVGTIGQATITNCTITDNYYGICITEPACSGPLDLRFTGLVSGRDNVIPGPEQPDGNKTVAVCPAELQFLMTTEGGELDWRLAP